MNRSAKVLDVEALDTLIDTIATKLAERLEPIVASAVERCVAARLAGREDVSGEEPIEPSTERMLEAPDVSEVDMGARGSVPRTLRSSGIVVGDSPLPGVFHERV